MIAGRSGPGRWRHGAVGGASGDGPQSLPLAFIVSGSLAVLAAVARPRRRLEPRQATVARSARWHGPGDQGQPAGSVTLDAKQLGDSSAEGLTGGRPAAARSLPTSVVLGSASGARERDRYSEPPSDQLSQFVARYASMSEPPVTPAAAVSSSAERAASTSASSEGSSISRRAAITDCMS
jgi:hypothetical protein